MLDRQAIADLYDRHASRLYAIALRITGDRDFAADALAETFVALGKSNEVRDPETYLIRATRDHALSRQTQKPSAAVVPQEVTPRQLVEEAWYGMTVSDLATTHKTSEATIRTMLCDGMAQLRSQFAAGTK
ncbi:MAG: Sigma-70 region 2 [Thermoanaerobaculia bacterium]|jgi:DNA-directed RNA polymerase specialized sigma24 family protein|nr:Sigma-70 region 2 [Thermoanaerobaculia bacterium]